MEIFKKAKTSQDYLDSAVQFRVCEDWRNGYKAYMKAFELSHETNYLNEAGDCAEKFDSKLAEECYHTTNNHSKLGQLYEKLSRFDEAIEQYEIVIHESQENIRHDTENSVARVMIQKGDYYTASVIYKGIAKEKLNKPLGKWAAYDFVFKAALCCMASQTDWKHCEKMFPGWKETPCYRSCEAITKAIQNKNKNLFHQTVFHLQKNFSQELVNILYELKKLLGDGITPATDIS